MRPFPIDSGPQRVEILGMVEVDEGIEVADRKVDGHGAALVAPVKRVVGNVLDAAAQRRRGARTIRPQMECITSALRFNGC